MTRIETARLVLRPVEPADAAATAALLTPAVSRWLASWPQPCTLDLVADRIETHRRAAAAGDAMTLALVRKADDVLLGWLGVYREPRVPAVASLGYFVGEAHQRQGYSREAAAAALPVALDALQLARIEAAAQLDNTGSIALLRGLGLSYVGERAVFASARGRDEACAVYALRRSPTA
jgi:ribosomal-protein-alanine N-acetyltransferase